MFSEKKEKIIKSEQCDIGSNSFMMWKLLKEIETDQFNDLKEAWEIFLKHFYFVHIAD